jgi:hypothetical protein
MGRTIATERDWLRATRPEALWYSRFARDPRRRTLAACGCARRILPILDDDPRAVALITAVEQFADAEAADAERHWAVVLSARRVIQAWRKGLPSRTPRRVSLALDAVYFSADRKGAGPGSVFNFARVARHGVRPAPAVTEQQMQVALVRDVFGNPFRPIDFLSEWRTSTVVALARQTYDSRDFSAMPILADALQDAGCDNNAVLGHCRGEGPHLRGCWVVDACLGME